MKKSIILVISLLILSNYANAATYKYTKCPQWEDGDIVYYDGKAQNTAGTAPDAFCWDITKIQGIAKINGSYYANKYENLTSDSSTVDWYAQYSMELNEEVFIGTIIKVVVMGYGTISPRIIYNSTIGTLLEENTIYSPSGTIINGKEYTYFIKIIESSNAKAWNNLDINGTISVRSGAKEKDSVIIK